MKKIKLLNDKEFEIKVLTIPRVKKKLLSKIIYSELMKFSINAGEDDTLVGYEIIQKNKANYNVVVFITSKNKVVKYKNCITSYHIVQKIVTDAKRNDDTLSIVIPSKVTKDALAKQVYFLYLFVNGRFIKREILFEDDIKRLSGKNLFLVNLFGNQSIDNDFGNRMTIIPDDKIQQIKGSIKKRVFKQNKFPLKLQVSFALVCVMVLLLGLFGMQNIDLSSQIASLQDEVKGINKQLIQNRSNNDKLQSQYNAFKKFIKRKSKVNPLFYTLYSVGSANLKIKRLQCSEENYLHTLVYNFSIEGECKDDQKLENNFRKNPLCKDISFSFVHTKDKTNLVIRGKFDYE